MNQKHASVIDSVSDLLIDMRPVQSHFSALSSSCAASLQSPAMVGWQGISTKQQSNHHRINGGSFLDIFVPVATKLTEIPPARKRLQIPSTIPAKVEMSASRQVCPAEHLSPA